MTSTPSARIRIALAAAVAAVISILLFAEPAAAAAASERGAHEQCFSATVGKRKTSVGVHQWTARQHNAWCVERRDGRRRIVSVARRTTVRTGTNWTLVSRSGGTYRDGASRVSYSHFHFRLQYPFFEQNCYPRLELRMWPSGRFEGSTSTGC